MPVQVSDEEILSDLQLHAEESGTDLTAERYNEKGKYSRKTVERRFGSWNSGKGRAGLEVCSPGSDTPPVPSNDGLNKEKRWQRVDQIKEQLPCSRCGRNPSAPAMDFHHVDPSTKTDSMARLLSRCFQWGEIVKEIKKCSLLCAVCHREVEYCE